MSNCLSQKEYKPKVLPATQNASPMPKLEDGAGGRGWRDTSTELVAFIIFDGVYNKLPQSPSADCKWHAPACLDDDTLAQPLVLSENVYDLPCPVLENKALKICLFSLNDLVPFCVFVFSRKKQQQKNRIPSSTSKQKISLLKRQKSPPGGGRGLQTLGNRVPSGSSVLGNAAPVSF